MPRAKGFKQDPEHVRKRIAARLETLRKKPRGVSEEWLRQKYEVERLGTFSIAAMLGRDNKTIWSWLKHYGIQTRKRGADSREPGTTLPPNWTFKGRKHTEENKELQRKRCLEDGRVPYLKNGVHYLKGKRGPEVHSWKGGLTPERQAFYSTPEWRAACVAVWHRADARCERCGLDHRTLTNDQRGSFHVHHIVSFMVRELRAELSNLALLCKVCHRFVHGKQNVKREFLG